MTEHFDFPADWRKEMHKVKNGARSVPQVAETIALVESWRSVSSPEGGEPTPVRVFRYLRLGYKHPSGPVYRVYPEGHVTYSERPTAPERSANEVEIALLERLRDEGSMVESSEPASPSLNLGAGDSPEEAAKRGRNVLLEEIHGHRHDGDGAPDSCLDCLEWVADIVGSLGFCGLVIATDPRELPAQGPAEAVNSSAPATTTEWGRRWPNGAVQTFRSREVAEGIGRIPGSTTALVHREVGEWYEVDTMELAGSVGGDSTDTGAKPSWSEQSCPHGILRGMMTCPVCDPEKQAAAEESAAEAVRWVAGVGLRPAGSVVPTDSSTDEVATDE